MKNNLVLFIIIYSASIALGIINLKGRKNSSNSSWIKRNAYKIIYSKYNTFSSIVLIVGITSLIYTLKLTSGDGLIAGLLIMVIQTVTIYTTSKYIKHT